MHNKIVIFLISIWIFCFQLNGKGLLVNSHNIFYSALTIQDHFEDSLNNGCFIEGGVYMQNSVFVKVNRLTNKEGGYLHLGDHVQLRVTNVMQNKDTVNFDGPHSSLVTFDYHNEPESVLEIYGYRSHILADTFKNIDAQIYMDDETYIVSPVYFINAASYTDNDDEVEAEAIIKMNDNSVIHSCGIYKRYDSIGYFGDGLAAVVIHGDTTDIMPSGLRRTDLFADIDCYETVEIMNFLEENPLLPITLTSFSAVCDQGVRLFWETASETNVSHYAMLRSRDGINWEEIGIVNAVGNSTSSLQYSMLDPTGTSAYYYKLSSIDYDGVTSSYGPISVNCNNNSEASTWNSYPNPVHHILNLHIHAFVPIQGELLVKDGKGKIVLSQHISLIGGSGVIPIDWSDVSSGYYIIHINGVPELLPIKVVKY